MRNNERNYECREKIMKVHKDSLRDFSLMKKQNEMEIHDGLMVDISEANTLLH